MNFADALISEAKTWTDCKEDKNRANRSVCVDKIHNYSGGGLGEAWCAKFVYMIVDTCAKAFKVANLLPQTASTIAMHNDAALNGLRVDSTPAPGSIFFYRRDGGGHVGFVVSVDSNYIYTIEGNYNDAVGWNKRARNSKTFAYIHTEEMAGDKILTNGFFVLLATAAAAGAAYYIYKKRRKK